MRWWGKGHRRKSVSQFYQVGCYTLYIIHNSLSNLYSLAIPFITLIARSFLQGIDWLPHPYLYHMCVAIWFWTQPCLSLCVHILVHIHHIRILFQLDINCQSYRYRSVKNWHLIESDEYFEILSDAVHRPFVFFGAKSCPSGDNVIHTRPSDIHPTYFYIMSEVFANFTNFQNSHEGIGAKKMQPKY